MKRILIGILITLFVLVAIIIGSTIYWFKNAEIKLVSQYNTVVVNKNELVDYKLFLNPTGRFSVLNHINPVTRRKIAEYMKGNNYKLAEGEQMFNIVIDDYEEYISEDFKFERIEK